AAMAAMFSYSWNVGGAKVLGGGARDVGRALAGKGEWTPEAAYYTAFAMNWAVMNTMYQYMKTGQAPWDSDTPFQDMMAARTGGTKMVKTDAATKKATGQEYMEVPEHILVPGITKDILAYDEHGLDELQNKLNPFIKTMTDLVTNDRWYMTDYGAIKGPVFQPKSRLSQTAWDMMPTWLGNIIDRMGQTGQPIFMQQAMGERDPNSGLNRFEQFMGVRQAPPMLSDPYHAQKVLDYQNRKWQGYEAQKAKKK